VLDGVAQSFAKPASAAPALLANPGDAARALMMPPAGADAAAKLAPMAPVKSEGIKVDSKVDIQAPFTLTVQGDVQDANALFAKLRPLLDQHQREFAQQLESRKLYDTPNI